MKFLITLLSSSQIKFLKASYYSAVNQFCADSIDYDIIIIVNTLNDQYYTDVIREFPDATVIRTESNGRPGKGHNSVIDYFLKHNEYDYLIPIDGDDFLYPCALLHYKRYIEMCKCDALFLMYHDSLSNSVLQANAPHYLISKKVFLNWNFESICDNKWIKVKSTNPFENNVNKLNTPGRLVLVSRKCAESGIVKYDEDLSLYDDFIVFMSLLFCDDLNVIRTSDTNLYLYNRVNEKSATVCYHEKEKENDIFQKSIKDKFLNNEWDLSKMPFQTILIDPQFSFYDKIEFCKNIIDFFEIIENVQLCNLNSDLFINTAKSINRLDIVSVYIS